MAERPKFIVSVYLKGRAPVNLYYKTKEAAGKVVLKNVQEPFTTEDDFCANMKLQSELALMQAKQNISTQSRARSDPALQIIQGTPGVGRLT